MQLQNSKLNFKNNSYEQQNHNNTLIEENSDVRKIGTKSPCISNTYCVSLLDSQESKYLYTKEEHQALLREEFIDKTESSLEASHNFMKNKSWINTNKWIMGKIERNLSNEWLDRYAKTLQVWKEIEYSTKELGLIPVFFTGTVIGELHPFANNSKLIKEDWKTEKLKEAYQELQELHTQIRKQAKRTLGYSPLFIRAIEYHKSFMPHSHIVYFVEPKDLKTFLKIIKNKEQLNENIGRTETKVLDKYDTKKAKSPVSYLLKYLKKTVTEIVKNPNQDNLKIFNGWKNTLGIKQLYNNSQFKIPKWAIKKVSYLFKNFEALGYRSMLEAIEKNVHIENDSIQIDKSVKTKIINMVENPRFTIYRKIKRYKYLNADDEICLADSVEEYIITNKFGEVLFDKSEFELIHDSQLSRYFSILPYSKLYNKIEYFNNVDYVGIRLETAQHLEYDILPAGCI